MGYPTKPTLIEPTVHSEEEIRQVLMSSLEKRAIEERRTIVRTVNLDPKAERVIASCEDEKCTHL
jgi:hypothetical protein